MTGFILRRSACSASILFRAVIDAQTKTSILLGAMQKMSSGGLTAADWKSFAEAQNDGCRSGAEIGKRVPDFTLPDQKRPHVGSANGRLAECEQRPKLRCEFA